MNDLAAIGERLARIETTQENQNAVLSKIDTKLETISNRVREVEVNSAKYGTLAGGVISVAVAYVSTKLKGV